MKMAENEKANDFSFIERPIKIKILKIDIIFSFHKWIKLSILYSYFIIYFPKARNQCDIFIIISTTVSEQVGFEI